MFYIFFLSIALLLFPSVSFGEITKIIIEKRAPFANGYEFPLAGAYEKLVGKAYGELDPKSPLNKVIVDLDKRQGDYPRGPDRNRRYQRRSDVTALKRRQPGDELRSSNHGQIPSIAYCAREILRSPHVRSKLRVGVCLLQKGQRDRQGPAEAKHERSLPPFGVQTWTHLRVHLSSKKSARSRFGFCRSARSRFFSPL